MSDEQFTDHTAKIVSWGIIVALVIMLVIQLVGAIK